MGEDGMKLGCDVGKDGKRFLRRQATRMLEFIKLRFTYKRYIAEIPSLVTFRILTVVAAIRP